MVKHDHKWSSLGWLKWGTSILGNLRWLRYVWIWGGQKCPFEWWNPKGEPKYIYINPVKKNGVSKSSVVFNNRPKDSLRQHLEFEKNPVIYHFRHDNPVDSMIETSLGNDKSHPWWCPMMTMINPNDVPMITWKDMSSILRHHWCIFWPTWLVNLR